MEHSDYSCKAYCPWMDESPTSLRIIDSQTQPRQKVIPKKMKKLIDGDLAAISGKRRSTKDRLKEKLRQKQEAQDQHLQEIGNKDVTVHTDVEQKSGKQKKHRRRSKKTPALNKQENGAKNEVAKQVESNEKVEVGETGKKLDVEISVPLGNKVNANTRLSEIEKPDGEISEHIDNKTNADTLLVEIEKPDGKLSVPTDNTINADTLLVEIEKLREEISVLVNNEVNADTLLAEIEKLNGEILEPIDNKVNANILSAETEKLSEEVSVPIDYELNAGTLLAEIEKLDEEISVPIDNKVNANTLLAEIEKLSEEISILIDNEEKADTLLTEIEKLRREISQPVDHHMNADTFLLETEEPGGEFFIHFDVQNDANNLLADTEKFSGEITEPVNASTRLVEVEKPVGYISESINIRENANIHLAEIEKFSREISEPVDNRVNANALLAEIEKPDWKTSVHTDNKINADTLLVEIEKLREEISNLVNKKVNADTLIAENEKLNGEIIEPTDEKANADELLTEIEKLSTEIFEPIDCELNIDTLLAEIKKLDEEISVPIDNKVNAKTLLAGIEELSEEIYILIDNEEKADTLLTEIEKLSREISQPVDHQMNTDTLLLEIEQPGGEFSVHTDKQKDANTLLADTEKFSGEITEPVNATTLLLNAEKPDGEISESIYIKESANTPLAEIEKLSREISEPVDNRVNANALLSKIEKPDGEISVHTDNKINADTLLAEIEEQREEISNLVNNEVNANTLIAVTEKFERGIIETTGKTANAETLLAEIEKFDGEISEPIDNKVDAHSLLAEIGKLSEKISVLIDNEENAEALLAEIEKLCREISEPVDHKVNADTHIAEIEKLNGEIIEPTDEKANADTLLTEIEKLSAEISEPIDCELNIDTLLAEIKKLDREFSVPNDNHVDANTHLADIEKPNTEIDEPIDNISNANTLIAEIENLRREIFVHSDSKINADTLYAETEIFVPVDNKLNADTHVAEIVKLGGVIPVPIDNKINADTILTEIKKLDGETSVPIDIKINAYTLLAEIEKLSEEITRLVDSQTNVDTLLSEIEKLSREISEPIHYKVNNDILLAEVEKFWGTVSVPVYNKLNADTSLAEIQKCEGDISVPVDKDWEISAPDDNKLNANTLLAETEKDKIAQVVQGASKKFKVSGQFRKRKYSLVADNLHKKLSRNNRVEILMSKRKKLIGNMKSEVELLRKKMIRMPDKIKSCINMEILFTDESQKLEANKVDILSPEMIKCLDVPTTARLGYESGFELYSVIPSQPSTTDQQLAAKHSRLDSMLIKEAHQEVLHMHLDISKEKMYTCLANFEQESLTQTKIKQGPLVNEISVCDVKYCSVFSISQVISDSSPHTHIITNTLEIKEKKRLLFHNLIDSQELRDQFSKIVIHLEDVRKIGLLFVEGINQMKKMSKTAPELVKCTGVSKSVFMSQIGLSRLFILYCDSGPGLFDFLAAMKIHGIPNTCMTKGIVCSSEKFLTARMRQRFVLTIFCPSATRTRPALPNAVCSWVDPVDFTQSDIRIYSTVEGKESALKVAKPWVKMKTKYIMNIHSTLQNTRMRQKLAAVQMVELCKKVNMIGSEITFESHYDKIQVSVNDGGLFNYIDILNDMVSRYMYLQGQQEVLPILETHTSQRGLKAQFMNFKIPIAMTGSLIKPVVNKRFMENAVRVQHLEDLDVEFKNLKEINILQNNVGGFVIGGITNIHQPNGSIFKGKMIETDFEFKIREKSIIKGSSSEKGNFHLNKKVSAQVAYKKREEVATLLRVENLNVSRKEKNFTFKCYDDGMKAIEEYSAFEGQTVTRSAIQTTEIKAACIYIERLHEQISKKLTVKRDVKQQTETVKILPLNLNIFSRYARRHELLKLRNSDRGVTAETVQETNNRAVERLSIGDNNTPCSQINDDAPGHIHEHSENITIIENLEQTHYGIRLCMFD